MTAALAISGLSSCTDQLEGTQALNVKDGDLVGEIALQENATRVAYAPGLDKPYVWSDDDAVRVYTVDKLVYNAYTLTSGSGTTTGVFSLQGKDNISDATSKKYAVSEPEGSNTIYGISATGDGNAMLTATIKEKYDWSTLSIMKGDDEYTGYKVPTPFWGEVTKFEGSGAGQSIAAKFNSLTAFLKLDLRRVAEGTQAIVLTSHEDYQVGDGLGNYVQIDGGKNEPLAGTLNAVLIDETSKLIPDTRLASSDTIRIDFDKILQVAGEDKVLYIPVVAQRYARLDVIAVTTDNRAPYKWGDAEILASYNDEVFYPGYTKAIYQDAMYEIPLGITDPLEISKIIASRYDGKHDVRVKIMDQVDAAAGPMYIVNNGAANGLAKTNVEITFAQEPAGDLQIIECPAAIVKTEPASLVTFLPSDPSIATINTKSMDKARKVTLNFEQGNVSNATLDLYLPSSDVVLISSGEKPTPNDVVTYPFNAVVNVIASRTNDISGYDTENNDDNPDSDTYNMKKAGLIVKGSGQFQEINVLEASEKTAVYVYQDDTEILTLNMRPSQPGNVRLTDALVGDLNFTAANISGTPSIWTSGAAAMKQLTGDQNKVKVHAYWTSKAISDYAVINGYEGAEVKDDEIASGAVYTAAQLQAMGLDYSLGLSGSAITSGAGVTDYTISKKVGYIWLGGQLFPWIGPQIGIMNPDNNMTRLDGTTFVASSRTLVDPDFTLYDPYDTQEIDQPVRLDGNWVELRNMELTINDPYFIDPHRCCTSCGEYAVKVERDLGLVRCINTTSTARMLNFRLNDVELVCADPKINIPNVGSLVGRISADNSVIMTDNRVTNIQIAISGGNAGGHVGNILTENGSVRISQALSGLYDYQLSNTKVIAEGTHYDATAWKNMHKYAETDVKTNFVATIGANAGGIVGQILAPSGTVQVLNSTVGMFAIISDSYNQTGGNNAGGLIGNLAYGAGAMATATTDVPGHEARFVSVTVRDNASVMAAKVTVDNIMAFESTRDILKTNASAWGAYGNNVGGFAGKSWAAVGDGTPDFGLIDQLGLQLEINGSVDVSYLIAQNRYAGGLIGYNKQAEAAVNDHVAATFVSAMTDTQTDTNVTIGTLEATNSCTGGLVGQQVMGDLVIGGGGSADNTNNTSKINVNITNLNTAFAGGGLVGQNLDDVDIVSWYRAGNKGADINVNVVNWKNTWANGSANPKDNNELVKSGFAGETQAYLRKTCGSFDFLGGLVSEHFKVWRNGRTNSGAEYISIFKNGTTDTTISEETKKALSFQMNTDATNTKGIATDPYWGDHLGYVGYADQTSFYLLNGSSHRQGDQQFNYRRNY